MSQSTNHTHNQNSDGSYHCYACLKEGATDYDADADGFTRGTIPADERIASRKLAQGSTNPKDDLDEILFTYIPCADCGETGCPYDNSIRYEAKARLQEYITLARIDELKTMKADAIMTGRYTDATVSGFEMEVDERIAELESALQRDSQPEPSEEGSDGTP